MRLLDEAARRFEALPAPDAVSRGVIGLLVSRASQRLASAPSGASGDFAAAMAARPIAEHVQAANDQHYELPPAFFVPTLGPRLKYSCCYYPRGDETLAQAEIAALTETALHADLADGQDILELGCGWGSLSLWMAAAFPTARITTVSNSAAQRRFIEARARTQALSNLTVVTADMNLFDADKTFDRIVSIEMFEHMANWRALLTRTRRWLRPNGRLFLHVFSHRRTPYRFDADDPADWIGRHFFSGGVMPCHDLIRWFADLYTIDEEWRWSGSHYRRTAEHWLDNFDRSDALVAPILAEVYGDEARLWKRRWRLFFLATAGLFGHADGQEWGVSHYRLKPSEGLR